MFCISINSHIYVDVYLKIKNFHNCYGVISYWLIWCDEYNWCDWDTRWLDRKLRTWIEMKQVLVDNLRYSGIEKTLLKFR
jgi:hypothetical protein